MKNRRWIRAIGTAASLVSMSTLATSVLAEDVNVAELLSEVKSLRTEVAQLREAKGENWMNQRRVEEVKALVREVLQDADARASLATGPIAGHNGKKFFLSSEDGTFLMTFGGRAQLRYIANFRNTNSTSAGSKFDPNETGFQFRRIKLFIDGHVASPKIGYKITIGADRNNTGVSLEEVIVSYRLFDELTIQVGRFKAPFTREEFVSSGKQLAAERSVTNEVFTMGFTEGIEAIYTHKLFRIMAMINDGQNQGEVSGGGATRDFDKDTTDVALTGRIDFPILGNLKQAEDFNAWAGEPTSLVIGAAAHYEVGENGDGQATAKRTVSQDLNSDGDTSDAVGGIGETINYRYDSFFAWTVDASFEESGLSLFAAIMGQHFQGNGAAFTTTGTASNFGNDIDLYGIVAQASYFVIADELEPFARYEYVTINGLPTLLSSMQSELHIITAGANYYIKKHNAKVTIDVVYSPEPLTPLNVLGTSVGGLGLVNDASGSGHNDQLSFRAQFQLQF